MKNQMMIMLGIILAFLLFFYFITKNSESPINGLIKNKFRAKGTIFYHEDDFCQIEIVPRENLSNLIKQAENIDDFSKENSFTDISIRTENKVSLSERKINKIDFEEILSKLDTNKHFSVITGYGSDYRIISKNTIGFGSDYSAIYFDYENSLVKNIWVTNLFGLNHENVTNTLLEIEKKWNLIMMDWNNSKLIDLSNKKMIERYLK